MRLQRQGNSLIAWTPAKLNLSLKVLGRRADGYHDLQTVMLSVQHYDVLQFSPAESGTVQLACETCFPRSFVTSTVLEANDRNLVIRAARLLKQQTGATDGVSIQLLKRIPMEAGMGGGSSDAAATLVALNQLWELKLSLSDLHELAAQLGSDVNFFLESPVAGICSGRGESIEAIPVVGKLHFVIVKPLFGLSTAKVFQEWATQQASVSHSMDEVQAALASSSVQRIGSVLGNDLTEPALQLDSRLKSVLQRLAKEDVAGSGMTGSGSSCFALCRTAAHAKSVAARCRQMKMGFVYNVTSGV
ncbi:4-(cytidine 5'-diphospho)-2-C-methyl-D-erythritol kinase [Planctomicrobium sp. SH527]|uniref:4-(cytidine 5'-diphospho)-2-C-methyl-D-erythritol kinase n=1 Tax=Planctomicrobium sp. SH527 TaxID=3448123 RepID=UPI003F5BC675